MSAAFEPGTDTLPAPRVRQLKLGYGARVTVAATLGLGLGVGGYAIAGTTVGAPSALSAISTSASKLVVPGVQGSGGAPAFGALGKRLLGMKPAALGTVTAVNGVSTASTCGTALTGTETGTFTLKTRGDDTSTTAVSDTVNVSATSTTFKDPAVGSASFANLCVGDMVAVSGTVSSSTVTATNVIILPVGFRGPGGPFGGEPGGPFGGGMKPAALGSVTAVNGVSTASTCGTALTGTETGTFTLKTRGDDTSTTAVSDTVNVSATSTTFKDPAVGSASFANLCVGDMVAVSGTVSSSTVTATNVIILPVGFRGPGGPFGGEPGGPFGGGMKPAALGSVTAVNGVSTASTCGTALTGTETGTFTLKTRGDDTSTTAVSDTVNVSATSTTFKDPAVGSASFANLCVGDMVAVSGTVSSSTVTATNVIILPVGFRGPGGPFGGEPGGPFGGGMKPAALGSVTAVNGVSTASTCGTALTGTETGTFTLKTRGDDTSTTAVSDTVNVSATSTTFKDPAVGSASFANLCVGDMVAVSGTVSSSTVTATNVIILPASSLDPGGPNMPWGGGGPGESWRSRSSVTSPPASSSSSAIKTA